MNRRSFIRKGIIGGTSASILASNPLIADNLFEAKERLIPDLKAKIKVPVNIDSIKLIDVDDKLFVLTTSKDGITGICQGNHRLNNLMTFFKNQVVSFFIGKDARNIEQLIEEVYLYNRNYKYAGMPLWNCVAHVELSILDLLGRTAQQPVNQLLGEVLRTNIPVYMSSLERGTTAQEEVEWVGRRIQETGAKAAKLKIGGRMSNNKDAYPGRTESLVQLARKTWGDDFIIFVDANGSYDAPKAIEIGRMLEAHNITFYEEPVPWEDFDATKKVADALDIMVAGGEQDTSMPKWKWMIENKALDLVQPDIMYNGGMIRAMKVGKMAEKAGIKITLHSAKNDALASYMLHFASITPNLGEYQEFRANANPDQSFYHPKIKVTNGIVKVPEGPGFGIEFDWDFIKRGKEL